jgi:sugar phosphate isomerase/epimerase
VKAAEVALLSDVFRRLPVTEAVRAAARAGFRHLELNACFHWDPHVNLEAPSWREEIAQVAEAAAEAGIAVTAVACYPNLAATGMAERRRAVAYCVRGAEAAAALGARCITAMPGGNNLLPAAPQRRALVEALREVCDAAAVYGVDVALESYPGNCVEGTVALVELVAEVDRPNLGYLLCTAHLAARGEDLVRAYALSRGVLRHVHLSDTRTATPHHQHLVPGLGDVTFAGLLDALARDGYKGTLTLQIYSHAADSDPGGAAAQALRAFWQLWPGRGAGVSDTARGREHTPQPPP